MISLKVDCIVKDGLVGFAMIATGLAILLDSNKVIALILLTISVLSEVIPYFLTRKKKKDIFDELAQTNSDKAGRYAFEVTTILLLLLTVFLFITNRSITVRIEHVWIVFGILKMIRCAFFCLFESSGE